MNYACYCGAQLQLAPEGNRWICPHGHQVYACKRCEAMGKNTPLQWIEQYQRWYCYTCQEYAPARPSGTVTPVSSSVVPSSVAQFLVPEEQLLFYSEHAEIKEHWGKAAQLAISFANTAKTQQADGRPTKRTKPETKTGELAITDRRIYLANIREVKEDIRELFSSAPKSRCFEVIFDPDYARQKVELAKAKNEEIKQQAKGVRVWSRIKFMKEQGFGSIVHAAVGASLDKAALGEEYIKLKICRIKVGGIPAAVGSLEVSPGIHLSKHEWELRIKRPLNLATTVAGAALTLAGSLVLGPILMNYKPGPNVSYEPILEIFQAKAKELSAFVEELETLNKK